MTVPLKGAEALSWALTEIDGYRVQRGRRFL